MSKKLFKTIGTIATVVAGAALVATGVGSVLGGTMLFTAFGASIAASTIATVAGAVSVGASLLSRPKAPATSSEATDRLSVSMDPRTPRKFVLGRTAMATDIRDQEFSNNQEYLHRFIVTASHKATAYEEIWFDDKKAWSTTGGVTSDFAGYLTVTPILEGSAANAINLSSRMGSTRRYTGLAYIYLRFKLTGNSKKAESPFAQSIPSRVTIIGKGAPTYDARLDSTVAGGSGPMRADDQTTWAWNDAASRNPALQLLWYLLGWRIKNPVTNEWRLAVGKGIPASRIDLASFITAANLCDEPVTLAAGGTQPRYRSDCVFSESDATGTVLDQLKAAMNAELDDVDGKIRITVLHNDLATPIADFNDDDILSGFSWDQTAPLDETYNVVRGTFIDPSTTSLYQPVEYPEVRIDSADGIDRVETVDFQTVQDASQAQRLVKQRIARMLYSGRFTATFSYRAWKVQKNDVVRLTFGALGWTNKLFRVVETAVQVDGQVPMVLQVENADIYLWDRDERPAIQPVQPTSYDPYLNPIYQDVVEPKYADGVTIDELRPAEPGATAGASPEERDLLAELDADIAQAEIDIAAAQQTIADIQASVTADIGELTTEIGTVSANLADLTSEVGTVSASLSDLSSEVGTVSANLADLTTQVGTVTANIGDLADAVTAAGGRIDTIQTTLGQQGASITSLQTTVSNHTGTLAAHTSQISAANASISINATAISTANQNIASLTTRVGTAESSISQQATAITGLTGRTASLETSLTSQGASITSLQTTTSTLSGNLAEYQLRLSSNSPNLLPNSTGEAGLRGYSGAGAVWSVISSISNAPYFLCMPSGAGTFVLASDPIAVEAGAPLTIGYETQNSGASGVSCYVDVFCYDASGNTLLDGSQNAATGATNWGDRANRAVSFTTPANTATMRVRLVASATATTDRIRVRRIKLERGTTWSAWSSEASIAQSFSAITTAETSLASLTTTVSTQGAAVSSQATAITNLTGRTASLETSVSSQGASITSLQSATSTQGGDIATLKTQMSTANANISTNATAITTTNQNLASLTTRVSSAESSITSQATAITGLTGRTASLETTVSSQGASITSLQTTTSTLSGNVATLTTQVSAGNPNLLPNGSGENGKTGWTGANFTVASDANGTYFTATANGTYTLQSDSFQVWANTNYTISAGFGFLATGGTVYVDMLFLNASGNSVLDGPENPQAPGRAAFGATGADRRVIAVTATAPATAVRAVARFVVNGATGMTYAAVRQIKVEAGSLATTYSAEASITQSMTSLTTLNSQYASLSTTVGTQGTTISSQATAITNLTGRTASLETSVSSQGASITSLQSATSTQGGDIATLKTQMSTANANISTNATAITTTNQNLASLTTRVSSAESSITSQATAITGLTGRTASLETTVSSQGASISSLQTTTSTIAGNVAALTTQVSAGNPNLLPNGGFENGGAGWSGANFGFYAAGANGAYAVCNSNGTNSISSDKFAVWPSTTYTISGSFGFVGSGAGVVYLDMIFYNASGAVVLDSAQSPVGQNVKPAFVSDGSDRKLIAMAVTSPATAVTAVARFVVEGATGISYAAVRQIKVEQGAIATPYSAEASAIQSFTALSTLTTQYASLSTTVSTQGVTISSQQTAISTINGNVSALFARAAVRLDVNGYVTGWEANNNGNSGNFIVNADNFEIRRPGSGAGFQFKPNEAFRMYAANGVAVIEMTV